jgi:hypothetical protein
MGLIQDEDLKSGPGKQHSGRRARHASSDHDDVEGHDPAPISQFRIDVT